MHRSILFSIGAMFLAARPSLAAPQIGDKAPKIKVEKWLTTAPPALPGDKDADKHVYIVEFWATWCGPCRKSIPHLADLHHKHDKDGLVILGISNEDAATIDKFLKKGAAGGKPMDMPYHVGADLDMRTNQGWMEDVPGIPQAYIVDKTSTVVWSGHPMSPDFDDSLRQVLAGKFDVQTAKNAAATAKKYQELMNQANVASQAQDNEKLATIIEQMLALKPRDIMPYLMKRHLLGEMKKDAEIPSLDAKLEEAMKDSIEGLVQIVHFQMEQEPGRRNAGQLYRAAKRAEDVSKGRDAEVLALVALVDCQLGMIDAAIATQDRAVGLAPDASRDEYKSTLKYYRDAKDLGEKAKS